MLEWMTLPLKRYTDFGGRSRRKEYWMFVLAVWIALIVTTVLDGILGLAGMVGGVYGLLTTVLYLGILIPSIAVAIRRCHDQDKSGWFVLVPIYNIILMFLEGTKGPNRFGPDPKNPANAEVFS